MLGGELVGDWNKNNPRVEFYFYSLTFFRSRNPAREEVISVIRVTKDAPVSGVFCAWEGV